MTRPAGSGSERQLQERHSYMKCVCVMAVPTMVISFVAIIVGAFAISKSEPDYAFPYCIGGVMIAGTFTCISSCLQYRYYNIYSSNKDRVTKEHANKWSRNIGLLCPCVCTALILGLVFSGLWGIVQASREKREFNKESKLEASAKINLSYSVASFVIAIVLAFLQIYLYCMCSKFKETYNFQHHIHGDDEFYIPTNSYTQTSPQRHTVSTGYETRVNYSNAGRRNQQSHTLAQDANRNAPMLVTRSPYTTEQLGRNDRHIPTHEQEDNSVFSIPVPELYHGREREASAPPGDIIFTGNDVNSNRNNVGMNPRQNINLDDSPPRYEDLSQDALPTYREVIEYEMNNVM